MSDRLDCEPLPSSVRSARLFVVDRLQEWRCDELVDTVALLTSELATNAVEHTGQPYSVSVERRGPGVRVEVIDRVHELPHLHDVIDLDGPPAEGPTEEVRPAFGEDQFSFSGLGIVDRTATSWGSEAIPGAGKVVWFEVMASESSDRESRSRVSDLSDLRRPAPGESGPSALEAADSGGDVVGDRPHPYDDLHRVGVGRSLIILLLLLVVAALAVAAFLAWT